MEANEALYVLSINEIKINGISLEKTQEDDFTCSLLDKPLTKVQLREAVQETAKPLSVRIARMHCSDNVINFQIKFRSEESLEKLKKELEDTNFQKQLEIQLERFVHDIATWPDGVINIQVSTHLDSISSPLQKRPRNNFGR